MHFKLFSFTENYWDWIKSLLLGSALLAPNLLNPPQGELWQKQDHNFQGLLTRVSKSEVQLWPSSLHDIMSLDASFVSDCLFFIY